MYIIEFNIFSEDGYYREVKKKWKCVTSDHLLSSIAVLVTLYCILIHVEPILGSQ